ncbi:hypothetical protein D8B29_26175 [Verminephrobacter eiseniae]|nr:hypothetical protein [Verminephrobacter eiseniae]
MDSGAARVIVRERRSGSWIAVQLRFQAADFSDPGQPFQADRGQRFSVMADGRNERECLGRVNNQVIQI